jgi:signal transduction histidine kinase
LSKIENDQFNNIEKINVNEVVKEKIELFKETFVQKDITLIFEESGIFELNIDSILCEMMINNLLKNAFTHNKEIGEIKIEISKDEIVISNSGKETSLNEKLIFNYFYKESKEKNSTGLGLVLIKTICKKHNLDIDYQFVEKKHRFIITKK